VFLIGNGVFFKVVSLDYLFFHCQRHTNKNISLQKTSKSQQKKTPQNTQKNTSKTPKIASNPPQNHYFTPKTAISPYFYPAAPRATSMARCAAPRSGSRAHRTAQIQSGRSVAEKWWFIGGFIDFGGVLRSFWY
jgi:hypothetical protein